MLVAVLPRMLKRATAAKYLDLAPAKFLAEVAEGRLSQPIRLGGEDHWDRAALDEDIDRLGGRALNDWRREQPGLAA